MKVITKEVKVYYSDDGLEYLTEEEALQRDKDLKLVGKECFLVQHLGNEFYKDVEIIPVKVISILEITIDKYNNFYIESLNFQNDGIKGNYSRSEIFETYNDAKVYILKRCNFDIEAYKSMINYNKRQIKDFERSIDDFNNLICKVLKVKEQYETIV